MHHHAATKPRNSAARGSGLNPALRDWIDRVIVPSLVQEYLAAHEIQNPVVEPAQVVSQSHAISRFSAEVTE